MTKLQQSYKHGRCPDCMFPIPKSFKHGDACKNCGHIFYENDYPLSKDRKAILELCNVIDEMCRDIYTHVGEIGMAYYMDWLNKIRKEIR